MTMELQGESNSISNQKSMLEITPAATVFPNRPISRMMESPEPGSTARITAMMEEVEAGNVEAIITKT